jgi:hypothetical protein
VFRREWGHGRVDPTAIFLSWDYSSVVFRATCDTARKELVLVYFGDEETTLSAGEPMAIRGSRTVELQTRLIDGRLEGRVKVTPDTLRAWSGSAQLEIDAPNAMGEPWYVGQAGPLRRLARLCL